MKSVVVTYEECVAGIWSLQCAECPLTPHQIALGLKGKGCMGGIATNMQGPMVLFNCPHSAGQGSVANHENGTLTAGCKYEEGVGDGRGG